MSDDFVHMKPFSLRFSDAAIEQTFREQQARKMLKPFRASALAACGIVLVCWALAPRILAQLPGAHERLTVPALITAALLAFGYARTYSVESFLRRHQLILLAAAWLFAMVLVGACSQLPRSWFDVAALFLIAVHTLNVYSLLRLRFPWACCAGWGTWAIYLGYLSHTGMLYGAQLTMQAFALVFVNLFGMIVAYQFDHGARREFVAMRMLGQERERSERLLLNVLPDSIADRLKASPDSIADHSANVTVLFADIVGFTPLSAKKSPQELVRLLDLIFSAFDALAEKHGLEKIKTIGDAYMAAAGLPVSRADHAPAAARMATEMLSALAQIAAETGEVLALRVGLNSGPVVAGVIGRKKFIYDMWGDTVNTASRMESHGIPGAVHLSEATAALLRPAFALTARGAIKIDGKGEMHTYLLG